MSRFKCCELFSVRALQQIDGYKISVADHLERVLNTLTPAVGQLPKN